jgi:signal transduction histidine kinase
MSIGQRLAIGFGLLLLVLAVFAGAVFLWHSQSANAQRAYLERTEPLGDRAEELERAMLYVAIGLRSYLLIPEPHRRESYRRYTAEARQALRNLASAAKESDEAALSEEIFSKSRPYLSEADRLAARRASGSLVPEEEADIAELRELALASVRRFINLQHRKADASLAAMAAARGKVSRGLAALSVIGAMLFLAVAYFTTQSIRRPTRELVAVAGALERGDWKPALNLIPPLDETATVGTDRSEMRKLSRAIGAAAAALEHRERELREKNERIQAQNAELIQQGIELRAHATALAEANERKNHFLGVLAHELRNPLAPISNSIFVMKRVAPGSEPAQRAQAVIERQTKHMIRLVDDLLDTTRISEGKIRVQREPLDLAATIRVFLEDQQGTLERSGVTLDLDMPESPVRVRGDHTRLSQVFGNLLSNAIKFTNPGGNISVRLYADMQTQEAVLRVADTGIGMDAALLPLLFKPFSQGPNGLSHTNGGLGLGLALVKALVGLHGGCVTAHSAGAHRGSEFIVRLPLDPEQVLAPDRGSVSTLS